jgi:probable DNA repair protein
LAEAAAAGETILTPNAELATSIFEALETLTRSSGRALWQTPKVRDFGGWLREQHLFGMLERPSLPRCLSEIEERELWRQVIEESPLSADLLDVGHAARAARRARRTVLEYAIPWSALQAAISEETRTFLEWNTRFEERCRELEACALDDLLRLGVHTQERIAWIESAEWRPTALNWLTARGRMLRPLRAAARGLSWVHSKSPDEELAQIAEWARSSLESFADFHAWICIPDLTARRSEVIDAFDAVLAPQRFALESAPRAASYAVAGGTPLADYPSVQTALSLLQASLGNLTFVDFSRLLRADELQADSADALKAAALDLELRRRGPPTATLSAWLNLCDELSQRRKLEPCAAAQRLRVAVEPLLNARGSRRMSEWATLWTQAFESGPWRDSGRFSSFEFQAVQRLRELMNSLAAADVFFGNRTREAAQRILRRVAAETAFQPETGVPPLIISGRLMDPWLCYDGLWVSGLSDERWPLPVEPVALLPVDVQRRYQVPAAQAQLRVQDADRLQQCWRDRAEQCVFSVADGVDGRGAHPSRLLPEGELRIEMALPRPHWHAQLALAPALERFADAQGPKLDPEHSSQVVATLRAQSRCAFKGFAEARLNIRELELPVPGFNEIERGDLTHEALELIWGRLRDSRALSLLAESAETALLEEAIERALRVVCARRDPGLRWRQRERERLTGLLKRWLAVERLRAPFRVDFLEEERTAQFAGLTFRCRLDRADVLDSGARVLIDYKTGSAAADWRGERPNNPQLPLYALLSPEALKAVAYGRVNLSSPEFVFESELPKIFDGRRRATHLERATDFAALIELWRSRIEKLAEDFAAGRADVAPTATACRTCRLQGLCRISADFVETEDE